MIKLSRKYESKIGLHIKIEKTSWLVKKSIIVVGRMQNRLFLRQLYIKNNTKNKNNRYFYISSTNSHMEK